MARITRVLQKIFASNASNNGVFGSAQAGTFATSTSLATLQGLPAYLNGWNSATITAEKLPTLEETQALNYINTTQLAYLFQEGIPEYDAQTEYHQKSIVKKSATYELYGSLVNNNTGNALVEGANWTLLCTLSDIASKSYVDGLVAGLSPKSACLAATTAALTATYANGASGVGATLTNSGALAAFSVDGQSPTVNTRILVKNQAAPAQNGIYRLTTVGSGAIAWVLTRTTDFDTTSEINEGAYTVVDNGTVNAGSLWIMTTSGAITVGTTAINFTQLTVSAVTGLVGIANGGTGQTTANAAINALLPAQTNNNGRALSTDGTNTSWAVNGEVYKAATASCAANAMTVGINATTLQFRNATLTNGTPNTRTNTAAATLVVPSGATLGAISGQAARYAVLAIDTGSAFEAAIVNMAGGVNLNEEGVISTTAISAGSTSASTIYSTTARSNVPYRVVNAVDVTQAAAGTHATQPSAIVNAGGNALMAMSSIGFGQVDTVVTRAFGTTYYNTTGKPIFLTANSAGTAVGGTGVQIALNGGAAVTFCYSYSSVGNQAGVGTTMVPAGFRYVLTGINANAPTVNEIR